MGVKDLWTILSPICERKSLWELQDKTVAVDLSGWICDSQNVGEHATQPRMYLRNLFFRTTCLLLLGAQPVFVLEGVAPTLKHDTIARRNKQRSQQKNDVGSNEIQAARKGNRSRLMSLLKQCSELLRIMGLSCIQSAGEAEALCALLDQQGLVDGCISQDSDCLLYGAQTVYRNFTISPTGGNGGNSGFSVDVYRMSAVEEKLSLGRDKLIAMSLLCGCDYNEKGVVGVGKESVVKFLASVENGEVLNRLRNWRTDSHLDELDEARAAVAKGTSCERCGHKGRRQKHDKSGCVDCGQGSGCRQDPGRLPLVDPVVLAELSIRKKALMDEDFPSEAMFQEFLQKGQLSQPGNLEKSWRQPDLITFIKYSARKLNWTEVYALEKFLPLVTRWQLNCARTARDNIAKSSFMFSPQSIIKKRVSRGVLSYEIQWCDDHSCLKNTTLAQDVSLQGLLVTVEPQTLVHEAYPELVSAFLARLAEKSKKGKRKPKVKDCSAGCTCETKENSGCKHQSKLDRFVVTQKHSIENLLEKLTLESKEIPHNNVTTITKCKGAITKTVKHKNVDKKNNQLKLSTSYGSLKLSDDKCCGKNNDCTENCKSSVSNALSQTKMYSEPLQYIQTCKTAVDLKLCAQHVSHNEECSDHITCDDFEYCMDCNGDSSLDLSAIVESIVGKENYHSDDEHINNYLGFSEKNKVENLLDNSK